MVAEGLLRHFKVVPERSAVVIEARSNVGPIFFGACLTGGIELPVLGSLIDASAARARLELGVDELASGNHLYDAELHRRIEARRYPISIIELAAAEPTDDREFVVSGEIAFHGVTRRMSGEVTVKLGDDGHMVITGEQDIDIREFDMAPPTMLMLKIQPDVRVRLHVEADAEVIS